MSNDSVVILEGARTPMGGLQGDLAAVPATELAATAIAAALQRSGIDHAQVDEVFMGCVLPAGLKQCPARQAAIGAGIPKSTGAVTVNKACGSGMQATIFGYDSIIAGTNRVVVTGGLESMSQRAALDARRQSRCAPWTYHLIRPHVSRRAGRCLHRAGNGHLCPGDRRRAWHHQGTNGRFRDRVVDPCQARH